MGNDRNIGDGCVNSESDLSGCDQLRAKVRENSENICDKRRVRPYF